MTPELEKLVEKYAKEHGIDPVLAKGLFQTESNWNSRAVSKVGAKGLGQLMPETAAEMGVTDPFDPEQNVKGSLGYLKRRIDEFGGDLEKAVTAYHSGSGNVKKGTLGPEGKSYFSKVSLNSLLYAKPKEEGNEFDALLDAKPSNEFDSLLEAEPKEGAIGKFAKGWYEKTDAAFNKADKEFGDIQEKQGLIPSTIGAAAGAVASIPAAGAAMGDIAIRGGTALGKKLKGEELDWAELQKQSPLSHALEPYLKEIVKDIPAAGPTMDMLASPFSAVSAQAGEQFGPGGQFAADVAMTVAPFAAAKFRGKKPLEEPKPKPDLEPAVNNKAPIDTELQPEGPGMYPRMDQMVGEGGVRRRVNEVDENGIPYNKALSEEIRKQVEIEPTPQEIMAKADALGIGYDEARTFIREGFVPEPPVLGAEPTSPKPSPVKYPQHDLISAINGVAHVNIEGHHFPRKTTLAEAINLVLDKGKKVGINSLWASPIELLYGKIFDILKSRVGDTAFRFDTTLNKPGTYDAMGHEITIRPGEIADIRTLKKVIAHEGIHALLTRELYAHPDGPYARSLEFLRDKVEGVLSGNSMLHGPAPEFPYGHYGMSDKPHKPLNEFVAELTRPEFQRALKATKLDLIERRQFYKLLHGKEMPTSLNALFETAWNAATAMVGKLFNIHPGDFTALQGLMEVVSTMGESPNYHAAGVKKFNERFSGQQVPKSDLTLGKNEIDLTKRETRTVEEIVKTMDKPVKDINDMGTKVNTASFRNLIKLQSKENRQNPAWHVINAMDAMLEGIRESQAARWHAAKADLKTIVNNASEIKGVVKAALDLENNSAHWFNGVDYWPTDQLLKAKGLNDKQIQVYRAHAKISDTMYNMLERIHNIAGIQLPPKVPGHFSHFWEGKYAIKLRDQQGTAFIFKYHSRREAKKHLELIRENGKKSGLQIEPDAVGNDIHSPSFLDKSMGDILKSLTDVAINSKALGSPKAPMVRAIINAIEARRREGIVTEMMERNARPMRGHELDNFVNNNWVKDYKPEDMANKLAERFESINKFLSHVEAVNSIYRPLVESKFLKDAPYADQVVVNRLNSFVGLNKNGVKSLETWFQKTMDKFGFDPDFAKHFSGNLASATSVAFLYKPAMFAASIFQPIAMHRRIQSLNAQLVEQGKAPVSEAKALALAVAHNRKIASTLKALFPDFGGIIKDPVIKRAVELEAIDPIMLETLAPEKARLSKLMVPLRKAEMLARLQTYLTGYYIGRQIHGPGDQAHYMAKRLTGESMVNYDPSFSAPMAFNEYGWPGRLGSVFQTYVAHEMGSLYESIKGIGAYKNPQAKMYAARAVMESILLQMSIAGIVGAPFVAAYDNIAYIVNKYLDEEWPDARTFGLRMGKAAGDFLGNIISANIHQLDESQKETISETASNIGGFGVAPYLAGSGTPNIASSMGGVSPALSIAPFDVLSTIGATGYWGAKLLKGMATEDPSDNVSRKQLMEGVVQKLPTHLRAPAEYALRNKNIMDGFVDLYVGPAEKDFAYDKQGRPMFERTKEDRESLAYFWVKSIRETKEELRYKALARDYQKINIRNEQAMQLLLEDVRFQTLSKEGKIALITKLAEQGGEPTGLADRIYNKERGKAIPGLDRLMIDSPKSPEHIKKYEERKKQF